MSKVQLAQEAADSLYDSSWNKNEMRRRLFRARAMQHKGWVIDPRKHTWIHYWDSLLFVAIMFTAVISALEKLQMVGISEVLSGLLVLAGQILLGLIILAFGNFLSNVAYKALSKVEGATTVAVVARYAILIVVLAIGLNAMGIADTIVNLAFGLSFGAIAVAVALSFGLGGREAAGKQMEYMLAKFRKD